MIEPFRPCDVDRCIADAPKVRGSGMGRRWLCVAHYNEVTARPGEPPAPVVAPVVAPAPEPAPAPAPVPVAVPVAPPRPKMRPSKLIEQQRQAADARYLALIAWMPSHRIVTATEAAAGLRCSIYQARHVLQYGAKQGRLMIWPSRGYSMPGVARPVSLAERVREYLKEHGQAKVIDIANALGLDNIAVSNCAKSSSLIMSAGRGTLKVREE